MSTGHTKLFTGSNIIVNGLKNVLDLELISYIIKDKFESARLAGFGVSIFDQIRIFVFHDELEKAKNILSKL